MCHILISIITARKRSLGQGNMFTGVCLSTSGAWSRGGLLPGEGCLVQGVLVLDGGVGFGVLLPGVSETGVSGGCLVPGGVPGSRRCMVEHPLRMATAAGIMHPTGMHSCIFNRYTKSEMAKTAVFDQCELLFQESCNIGLH